MLWKPPNSYFPFAAADFGQTRLAAFHNALKNVALAEYNLIQCSSILPTTAQRLDTAPKLEVGSLLPCIYDVTYFPLIFAKEDENVTFFHQTVFIVSTTVASPPASRRKALVVGETNYFFFFPLPVEKAVEQFRKRLVADLAQTITSLTEDDGNRNTAIDEATILSAFAISWPETKENPRAISLFTLEYKYAQTKERSFADLLFDCAEEWLFDIGEEKEGIIQRDETVALVAGVALYP